MPLPTPLPVPLLAELGKCVVIWAHIEQDLILHASAMAAQKTGGWPKEYLRMDLKRLRQKWYSLCREHFADDMMNKIINPLNSGIARFAPERGYFVHGMWKEIGPDLFHLSYWEQKESLDRLSVDVTLDEVKAAVAAHRSLGIELNQFLSGTHPSRKNKTGTLAKISRPLEPRDKR